MLPLFLLVAAVSASSVGLPVQSPTIECAACQMAAHMFRAEKTIEVGKGGTLQTAEPEPGSISVLQILEPSIPDPFRLLEPTLIQILQTGMLQSI